MAIIFGGPSPEHEVSLAGAGSVIRHASRLGWRVLQVGITKEGSWIVGDGALACLLTVADQRRLPKHYSPAIASTAATSTLESPPPPAAFADYEVAFPVCHGSWMEDGTLQGLLQCYGLSIVGCGVRCSAMCTNKHVSKAMLRAAGLPVTPSVTIDGDAYRDNPSAALEEASRHLAGGRCVVKPTTCGSSIGVSMATSTAELSAALDEALRWGKQALVEEYVPHREFLHAIVGSRDVVISPPGECIPVVPCRSYDDKYLRSVTVACPASVDDSVLARSRDLALAAYRALGCEVFARVDVFLDRRSGSLFVNEINVIPSMSEASAFPRLMRVAGYDYPSLLARLYDAARGEHCTC
jgi:D-alanine-D-alanine ligase